MKKSLLMTTALVALTCGQDAYAQISDDININQDTIITAENQQNYLTTGNISISGGNISADNTEGLTQMHDGSGQKEISVTGGSITLSNGAGLYADGKDGQYNTTAATMNITGGDITVKDGGEITLTGNADMNIGGNAKITMDYTGVTPEVDGDIHDGGILHEGKEGDINISGGVINLTGEAAKIERGGFDSSWVYKKDGTSVMSEKEFKVKTGKYPDEASPEDFVTAGLNPDELDLEPYHVSTGDINISGGEINLKDGARISLTKKNTGDINISGGKTTLENQAYIEMYGTNTGSVNLSGGELNINDNSGILLDGANNFTMTGGTLTATSNGNSADTGVFVKGDGADVNIQGGDINLTDSRIYKGNDTATTGDINISGGNITLNKNAYIEMRKENTGNVNMTGGKLVMNENSGLLLNTNDDQVVDGNAVKFIVNGDDATITANGNNQISGDIDVTKGTITVADGASLTSGDIAMNSENAKIDLSGKLDANVNGSGNLGFKNSAASVSGNVTGSNLSFEADHSLSKAIGGTIGNITALNVSKGTLSYDKDTGSIGNVYVAGGAGLDIGTNKLTAATVDFADSSTLGLKVASADNYGQINANTIKIGNDTTMKVTLDSGVVANGETKDFDFLQGSVTGDFTNKIADNNRYDISFEDGSFKITGTASASDVVADAGGSATNAATAEAWDTLTSSSMASPKAKAVASVLNDLSQSDGQAYVAALTAVAPEVAPMVQKTQTETANQVFGAVSTRLTGGSVSTGGEGMSSGDSIFKRGAMWVQGMFNKSKLDDTSKAKGFDADSSGIAFGAEKFVTDDAKVGVGYAYTNTDIDGFMRSTDVDTHTAIVYGEYKPNNWYVNGIATYGWSDYEENKSVAGVGVKADYDVETFGLQAMTGYDMNINGFGLTPEAGLRYVHIKQDAYKDSADQRVSGNDSDILTGVIGAKVSKNFELSNGMSIKPEARIAATYDLFNDDVNSVVTLANGSAYAVDGEALDRFGMEFGAGVTAEVNDNVELSLGYEGKFREDYQDHTGLINAKYKF